MFTCILPDLHEPKELTACFPVVKQLGFMNNNKHP